jgi:hypothetical protein
LCLCSYRGLRDLGKQDQETGIDRRSSRPPHGRARDSKMVCTLKISGFMENHKNKKIDQFFSTKFNLLKFEKRK